MNYYEYVPTYIIRIVRYTYTAYIIIYYASSREAEPLLTCSDEFTACIQWENE